MGGDFLARQTNLQSENLRFSSASPVSFGVLEGSLSCARDRHWHSIKLPISLILLIMSIVEAVGGWHFTNIHQFIHPPEALYNIQ